MTWKLRVKRALADAIVLGLGALAASTAAAQTPAACVPPQIPQPLELQALHKPIMPSKPACVDANRCRPADVKAYNTQVDAYNSALFKYQDAYGKHSAEANAYMARLNTYSADLQVYGNCERRRLMTLMGDAG